MDDILFGRKDLLEQVLLNLLSNSKDAFENINTNKEKYIIIKCLSNKEIFVEDNAGGITAQTIEKLFMPYFTTKEQGKGTGLGLYMSRKIIREHFNGNLTYTKDKNRSIFTLTIGERNG
jgi:C4-dicarboxylate-specific signal transduction histidine kinase